jgi:hypothetical protein
MIKKYKYDLINDIKNDNLQSFIVKKALLTKWDCSESPKYNFKKMNSLWDYNNTYNEFSLNNDFSEFNIDGAIFVNKLFKQDKIIIKEKAKNTNLYDQYDIFSVGHVINLNDAIDENILFTFYFFDKKTTDELKSITEYKVRGEFSELK